jgi:hypothetical protein
MECEALCQIDIPSSIEIISGFHRCYFLTKVLFAPNCRLGNIQGFCDCKELRFIKIPNSVEMISGFKSCNLLSDVVFEIDSRLMITQGFSDCGAIRRFEISPLVEEIRRTAFASCTSFNDVMFATQGRLHVMNGFSGCGELLRVIIAVSLGKISRFNAGRKLGELIFLNGSRICTISGFLRNHLGLIGLPFPAPLLSVPCNTFIVYENDDHLKGSCRKVNLNAPDAAMVTQLMGI